MTLLSLIHVNENYGGNEYEEDSICTVLLCQVLQADFDLLPRMKNTFFIKSETLGIAFKTHLS